ncbi:hypothetical protein Cst_c06840 [Thermoclostridium stercorarium subsp. stercorarium DSM 8532]|uniref:Uncharacterized protein n=1 Tax=Thermoclostridium stercorarium (strain ATCC 35414 / DSM 8532 / NCIMB 11754) TaxID=1121335 RepID=L7VM52_THES1|nr:hypothetical protein Cst_c06840 [Thermoclostridium stercorarium subsp. stercorarium DSM 8532]
MKRNNLIFLTRTYFGRFAVIGNSSIIILLAYVKRVAI